MNAKPGISAQLPARSPMGVLNDWLNVPVVTVIGCFSLFAIAFGSLADIEAQNDTVGFGGQAAVKVLLLALGGAYGGLGFLSDARVRKLAFSFPVVWMFVLLAVYFLSVVTSASPVQSLASTISIACVLLLTLTALVQMGPQRVLQIVFAAGGCFVLGSWLVYFFVPSIGVFLEPVDGGEFVPRMSGLSHPNTLGQFSGLTIVLGVVLCRVDKNWSGFRILVIALAVAALVGSLSRTSLLATVVAMGFVFRKELWHEKMVFSAIVGGVLIVAALIGAVLVSNAEHRIGEKFGALSKSGDAAELTTATGRTEIWAETMRLIGQRPLLGYGASTSKLLLQDYSLHTHNLVLNVALSTGVLGGLLMLWVCVGRIAQMFIVGHVIADALIVFILVNGMFENVIFAILCGLPTILWVVGLALPLVQSESTDDEFRLNGRFTSRVFIR